MKARTTMQGLVLATSGALGAMLSLPALAGPQEGAYVGGGLMEATIDFDGYSGEANPTALFARVGYQMNDFLAVEGRLGTGFDDDHFHGANVEVEDMIGAYAKVGIPTTVGLYPYAMLGVTSGEISVNGHSDDDSDVSYGIGVDYWVAPQVSIGLEYMSYVDIDGADLSGITLGANYRF